MTPKQIHEKYVESTWEVVNKNKLLLVQSGYSSYGLILCHEDDFENIVKENSSNYNKLLSKLNSLEDFKKILEEQTATTLKNPASRYIRPSCSYAQSSQLESFTKEINEKIINRFLSTLGSEDRKIAYEKLDDLTYYYGYNSNYESYWQTILYVDKVYGSEEAIYLFNKMPAKVGSFSKRDDLKEIILKNIAYIQDYFRGNSHPYIYQYIKLRAKQANVSQIGSIALREALISKYSNNQEKLEEYKELSPSLKKYLETSSDGNFYIKKVDNLIHKVVDVEDFKAVVSIDMSTNEYYKELLIGFLHCYRTKDDRITKFDVSYARLNSDKAFITMFVLSDQNNPLKEEEFDEKFRSFVKMLNKENPKLPSHVTPLMDKWWDADELEKKLNKTENKEIKRKNKI